MYLSWEVGLFRSVAEGLRQARHPVPTVQSCPRAGAIPEPLEPFLPLLPAPALESLQEHGACERVADAPIRP